MYACSGRRVVSGVVCCLVRPAAFCTHTNSLELSFAVSEWMVSLKFIPLSWIADCMELIVNTAAGEGQNQGNLNLSELLD